MLCLNPSAWRAEFTSTDCDGRLCAFNFNKGGTCFRIVNICALAKASALNNFFRNLGPYLLHSGSTTLCGDFHCILDSDRNVRGPGQGRPIRNAAELGHLVRGFQLVYAWALKHRDEFQATWRRGSSESRLDRFYKTRDLVAAVAGIDVVMFPDNAPYVSDHKAVLLAFRTADGRYDGTGIGKWTPESFKMRRLDGHSKERRSGVGRKGASLLGCAYRSMQAPNSASWHDTKRKTHPRAQRHFGPH